MWLKVGDRLQGWVLDVVELPDGHDTRKLVAVQFELDKGTCPWDCRPTDFQW